MTASFDRPLNNTNTFELDARKLFGEFTKSEYADFENQKNKLLMEEEDKTINLFYMELDEVDEKMPCIQYDLTELESTLTKNKLKREFKQTSEEESNQSFLDHENDDLDAFFREEKIDNLGAVFSFTDEFRKKKVGTDAANRYEVIFFSCGHFETFSLFFSCNQSLNRLVIFLFPKIHRYIHR